jgi:hypothetical protein
MSALTCPFWCLVHGDGVTLTDRPHEGMRTVLDGLEGGSLAVVLLQHERRAAPELEFDIDGRSVLLRPGEGQRIVDAIRDAVGVAMRAAR